MNYFLIGWFVLVLLFNSGESAATDSISDNRLREICFLSYSKLECDKAIEQLKLDPNGSNLGKLATVYYYFSEKQTDPVMREQFIQQSQLNYQKALKLNPLDTDLLMGSILVNDSDYERTTLKRILEIEPQRHLTYIFLAETYFRATPSDIDAGLKVLFKGYKNLKGDRKVYMAKRLYSFYIMFRMENRAKEFSNEVIRDSGLPLNNKDYYVAINQITKFCSPMLIQIGNGSICKEQLNIIINHVKKVKDLTQTEVDVLISTKHKLFPLLKKDTTALQQFKELLVNIPKNRHTANYYLLQFLLAEENNKEKWLLLAAEQDSAYKAQATMWLCEFYFNRRKYKLAQQQCKQIENTSEAPWSTIAKDYLKVISTFQNAKARTY